MRSAFSLGHNSGRSRSRWPFTPLQEGGLRGGCRWASLIDTMQIPRRDAVVQGLRRTAKVVADSASHGGRVVAEKSSSSVARAAPYARKDAGVTRTVADTVRRETEAAGVAVTPKVKVGATATGRALKKAAKASTPYATATGKYVVRP